MKRTAIEITDPKIIAFYRKLDEQKERRTRGNYVIKGPELRAKIKELKGGLSRLKEAFDPRFHDMLAYRRRYREFTRELRIANEIAKKQVKGQKPGFREPPVSRKFGR